MPPRRVPAPQASGGADTVVAAAGTSARLGHAHHGCELGVQFIGGEPTLHPASPELLRRALAAGLEVEVFSNLVHVTPALW
ncbi:MAG TPA: hypothetical protein VGL36_35370 [Kribbella sp.]